MNRVDPDTRTEKSEETGGCLPNSFSLSFSTEVSDGPIEPLVKLLLKGLEESLSHTALSFLNKLSPFLPARN